MTYIPQSKIQSMIDAAVAAMAAGIPTNNNQLTNGASYITGITAAMVSAAMGYTSYEALVSQSGTSAPTASRKDSNFSGVTFTWARTGAGTFTLTASSAVFTANKTAVRLSQEKSGLERYTAVVTSTTVITVSTGLLSGLSILTGTDALLSNVLVEIRVYN